MCDSRGEKFRTDFARLDTLRFLLGDTIPFGACTATATPEKLKLIRAGLGIPEDAISIVEPIKRPNLFLAVKQILGNNDGSDDFRFLIPLSNGARGFVAQSIPSTIIYMDSIPLGDKLAWSLRDFLPKELLIRPPRPKVWDADQRSDAEKVIAVYNTTLSKTVKQLTQQDWRNGVTHIVIPTSACGMGINDSKVSRVIQWKCKNLTNLDTLIQRFGRCARDSGMQGVCILFAKKSFFGEKCEPVDKSLKVLNRKQKANGETIKRATAEQCRVAMDPGLFKFINTPGIQKCGHKVFRAYYDDAQCSREDIRLDNNGICYDNCGSDEINKSAPEVCHAIEVTSITSSESTHTFPRVPPGLQIQVRKVLNFLRSQIILRDYHNQTLYSKRHILSNKQILALATAARGIMEENHAHLVRGLTFDKGIYRKYGMLYSKLR